MNCPKCGAQIPEGKKFCVSCGTKITDAKAPAAPPTPMAPPPGATPPPAPVDEPVGPQKAKLKKQPKTPKEPKQVKPGRLPKSRKGGKQAEPEPGEAEALAPSAGPASIDESLLPATTAKKSPFGDKRIMIGAGAVLFILAAAALYFFVIKKSGEPQPGSAPAPTAEKPREPKIIVDLIPSDTVKYMELNLDQIYQSLAVSDKPGDEKIQALDKILMSVNFGARLIAKETLNTLYPTIAAWNNGYMGIAVTSSKDNPFVLLFGSADPKKAEEGFPQFLPISLKIIKKIPEVSLTFPALNPGALAFGRKVEHQGFTLHCTPAKAKTGDEAKPETDETTDTGDESETAPAAPPPPTLEPCWVSTPIGVIFAFNETALTSTIDGMKTRSGNKARIIEQYKQLPEEAIMRIISDNRGLKEILDALPIHPDRDDVLANLLVSVEFMDRWAVITKEKSLKTGYRLTFSGDVNNIPYVSQMLRLTPGEMAVDQHLKIPGMTGSIALNQADKFLSIMNDFFLDDDFQKLLVSGYLGAMLNNANINPVKTAATFIVDQVGIFTTDELISGAAGEFGIIISDFTWPKGGNVPNINTVLVVKVKDMDAFKKLLKANIKKSKLKAVQRNEITLLKFGNEPDANVPAYAFNGDYFIWGQNQNAVRLAAKAPAVAASKDKPLLRFRFNLAQFQYLLNRINPLIINTARIIGPAVDFKRESLTDIYKFPDINPMIEGEINLVDQTTVEIGMTMPVPTGPKIETPAPPAGKKPGNK